MSLRLILIVLIVLLNGFFAAAEVSLVSVRRSRLKQLAGQGSAAARAALDLLANPSRLLSVTQVGVTLASLGLGWVGQDTLYRILVRVLNPLPPISAHVAALLHGIVFALAFLIISYVHVVIGEVLPKNLALAKADRVALLMAPALLAFLRISAPFVFVIERSAAALSRALGVGGERGGGGHSTEELKFIVESSRHEGHLEDFEEDAIRKLLELKRCQRARDHDPPHRYRIRPARRES